MVTSMKIPSIANNFNDYFNKMGNFENSNRTAENAFENYLDEQITSTFNFRNISHSELLSTIKSLSDKHSSGYDNITLSCFKKIGPSLSQPLLYFLNNSMSFGIFPDYMKVAKIIPIHKKGRTDSFTNYRPISLLPSISKLFEKIINKQLMTCLEG